MEVCLKAIPQVRVSTTVGQTLRVWKQIRAGQPPLSETAPSNRRVRRRLVDSKPAMTGA